MSRRATPPSRRKRTPESGRLGTLLWLVCGFLTGLFIGGLLPWAIYLDRIVAERFVERQWKQAGRVYARPLEIYPGLDLAPASLEHELGAAGLQPLEPLLPGRWRKRAGRYVIAVPQRQFADGKEPPILVEIDYAGERIDRLRDSDGGALDLVRLPPAELGSLLPLDDRDRTLIPIEGFPSLLTAGVQAVEDRQFRHHHGLDPRAILRALLSNLRSGDIIQGGSTITQQLVKNLFLDADRTLARKANEAIMSLSLEARFSKAEILEAYLNEVFLGQTGSRAIHGFGRAAEYYFGVPVSGLSADQIALLVGMVRGASWYHPTRNPERALARRNQVLAIFHETRLIDDAELVAARARPLGVDLEARSAARSHPAFMDLVARQLKDDYRDSDLRERGLKIYTTLSPSAQHHAEQALATGLAAVERQANLLQGAIVLAEPSSGEIRALVGDRDYRRPGFNRALDARRPVGSVIKPFLYLLALADPERFTLISPLEDRPIRVAQPGREDWKPGNYGGTSHGIVPLLDALAQSYNQATVALGLKVGVPALFRLLEQLGVAPGSARHPAAFLGAIDLTPLQVTQLYQALASGGYASPLRAITDVVDRTGQAIARYPIRLRPVRERDALALLDFALADVVERGTGRSLKPALASSSARQSWIRGKTGTTSDRRDAWFAGYTEQWLGVVWIGRDDNLPAGISGATAALPVWARLFDRLPHDPRPPRWPAGLDWFWIDWPRPELADRDCAGARAIPFIRGSQPRQRSNCMR
ncbi:MAG: penicillin-binding protein 1B [Gammaproteobacteria bacterium]|nr:penicillin-binding protein 1B [Gammaproteobacteria bacterium]